jgi:putative salt-induced outer membrane protein YdiY
MELKLLSRVSNELNVKKMKALPVKSILQPLCGALVLLSSTAHAIVNVEQAIIGKPSEGVHTSMDLLASGASGNTDTSSTKANFLTLWQHGEQTEFLQLQYAYGKSGGLVDTDKAFAHLRHRTAISPDWAIEGFAQIGRDPFARLTQRTLFGGGMRWVMFEEENKSAGYLGFGAFHENEILTDKLGTSDPKESNLWRANTYLVLKSQLNEQVRVYSTTYYQPAFSDTADYRMLEQASMLVKLRENLDFKVSLDISFDSMPPQTVQKRDLAYSTGLEFSF